MTTVAAVQMVSSPSVEQNIDPARRLVRAQVAVIGMIDRHRGHVLVAELLVLIVAEHDNNIGIGFA